MAEVTTPGVTQAQVSQTVASAVSALAIPAPATAAPPGVSDTGAQGNIQRYAMENHTHAAKARKEIRPISASGIFTWVYPTPFAAGVVPIVNGIAICPSGTTDIVNCQLEGDPTNTQAVFRIARFQQSVVSLLGLITLSLNAGVPANTKLSLSALEP